MTEIHFITSCNECPFKGKPHKMILEGCKIDDTVFINPDHKLQPNCPLKTKSIQITLR